MSQKSDLKPSTLICLLSCVLITLSLMVIAGWLFKIPVLVQLLPNLVPMPFNTALCFSISGLALIALCYKNKLINSIPIILILGITIPTLMEYLLAKNLGIDNLFVEPFVSTSTPHPGRMAIVTAVCFSLFAAYIALLKIAKFNSWFVVGMLPATIFVIGTTTFWGIC